MSAPRVEWAIALVAELGEALTAAGLDKVTVSLNPLDIPSGARHGVVVISPPDMEFPTYSQTDTTTELAIVAGPAENIPAAWRRLDEIIEALRGSSIRLQSAEADMFAVKTGPPLPGYAVTLHPETLLD